MVIVVLLAGLSFDGSCHFASDYWRAVFGIPEVQWQSDLSLVPFMIGLGVMAALIATFPRPRFSKIFACGS